MELIDILDEKGNKTGLTKSKKEVHEVGDWHLAVHVWFVNSKNEILLQFRSATMDSSPSMWDISSAGHASAGDESVEAGLREVKEELGIKLEKEELKYVGTVHQKKIKNNGTYLNNEFNDIYVVRKDIDIKDFILQKEEVEKIEWIPISKLKEMVASNDASLVSHTEEYKMLFNYLDTK